jgi:DedD protein
VNHLLDSDTDLREDIRSSGDHEISLGIPTILGIFFALALICAVFFGFGYTLGRKSAQNAAAIAGVSTTSPSITLKPTAGSAVGQVASRPATAAPDTTAPAAAPSAVTVALATSKNGLTPADAMIAGDKPIASNQPAPPAISPGGTFMVQIAAVSSQEIADIEVAALKKYDYDVVIRHEPQDQLLHIQIGPFATRKDADAMRANVQAHGFNAIVK